MPSKARLLWRHVSYKLQREIMQTLTPATDEEKDEHEAAKKWAGLAYNTRSLKGKRVCR